MKCHSPRARVFETTIPDPSLPDYNRFPPLEGTRRGKRQLKIAHELDQCLTLAGVRVDSRICFKKPTLAFVNRWIPHPLLTLLPEAFLFLLTAKVKTKRKTPPRQSKGAVKHLYAPFPS